MHPTRSISAALLAIAPLSGLAQTQSETSAATLPAVSVYGIDDTSQSYNPPDSSSATKIDAPLRDIPQTVNVVPAQVMRDQHANSLQDALKNVPGVSFSSGDGQRDQVSIRGFTAIADQYVDGFRDDALYYRDLSNVERVDVIKGPAAVLYGRGSSGGLINRITKKPGEDITQLGLSYGSWNDRRLELDLGRATESGSMAWRLTGAVEKGDSYRDKQFLDRKAIAPSAMLRLGEDTTFLIQTEFLEDRRVTDFGIPAYRGRPVDVDPSTYYGAENARDVDYTQARVQSYAGTLNHRFNGTWSLRNATRYYHYTLDRNNTLPGVVNEAAQTVTLNRSNVRREEHGWTNQTELTQRAQWGSVSHEILYGVEVGQQNKDLVNYSANNVATVDLFDPVLPTLPMQVGGRPSADNLGRFNTLGLYVQDMVSLGEHWKMLGGVRHDRFEQKTEDRRSGARLSRTDSNWSPRLGLVYQPDAMQSYYVSWSQSYQPSGEAFSLAASNADLAPEKTTNYEIGAKYDFLDGKLSTTVSIFRLERTDIKVNDPVTNSLVPVGTQRTDGAEWTLSGDLGDGWRAMMGYAYLDARVTESIAKDAGRNVEGKRATLTPRHAGNIWVTKDLGDGFGAGAGLNLVGARYANPGNTVRLPGYVTADVAAWWRKGPYAVQLNVYNLFDAGYIVSAHGTSPNLNMPGAPRNAMLSLQYRM
ncbi:TonB-dependent receptor [Achromobacter sp. HZ01]|uniref:TonB-dependent siderophore receptor n=1 Tax=Achromobacter pulmonis TaxID=1389932 RepID=A0A2N8KKK5_9BURK|nr:MULTISPECIES: TonB-dependent siderophore receptor [Achromobacter]PND33977.1 TonB-dependent siderophore receptor [Achromobacter pulmonis]RAP64918.1 TonB-dependent receptor [Achromobacter sp. HZ01]